MKKMFLISLTIILIFHGAIGQTIKGEIIDSETNKPLPFVNIGVVGKDIGTVSNDSGVFELTIPNSKKHQNDTLRFSMIGYEDVNFLVGLVLEDWVTPINIKMKKKAVMLPLVTIDAHKFKKTKILGNKKSSRKIVFYFQSNKLGTELASLIKVKKGVTYIKDANFNIAENNFGEIFFRLNIYNCKNNAPAEKLLNEEIIVKTSIQKGIVKVDLSSFNLMVKGDFFISLEWIQELAGGNLTSDLQFCSSLSNGTTYIKKTSHSQWREFNQKKFGLKPQIGFYVTSMQ